jgi:hypothetical protein
MAVTNEQNEPQPFATKACIHHTLHGLQCCFSLLDKLTVAESLKSAFCISVKKGCILILSFMAFSTFTHLVQSKFVSLLCYIHKLCSKEFENSDFQFYSKAVPVAELYRIKIQFLHFITFMVKHTPNPGLSLRDLLLSGYV